MSKIKIITTPDPRLREPSKKVTEITPTVKNIIKKMVEASLDWEKIHEHELSAAMAAPQLGENVRIIIIRDDLDDKENNHFTALINPEILSTSGRIEKDYEGCLSVPYYYGLVPRPKNAKIRALLEDGTPVKIKAEGVMARTLLHEIDHLNGVLFIDHIRNNKRAWKKMNDKGDLEPVDYDTEIKDNKDHFPDD